MPENPTPVWNQFQQRPSESPFFVITSRVPKSKESVYKTVTPYSRRKSNQQCQITFTAGEYFGDVYFLGFYILVFIVLIESYQGFEGKVNWFHSNPALILHFSVGCIM